VLIFYIYNSQDIPQGNFDDNEQGQLHKAAEQADALVDIYYYSLNAACKKGMNLSALFDVVHQV
jgi:predicted HAD superfamily Cof-like phosphohydrolase